MSTSARKKLARQKAHAKEKAQRQYEKALAARPARKKSTFTEYKPSDVYRRETPDYPSLMTNVGTCAKKESQKYTGDLIVGIGTMHKSNAVPIMRGTSQAEEIAKMRRG